MWCKVYRMRVPHLPFVFKIAPMKVFIIDDDEISIFLTERSIQLGGYNVNLKTFLSAEDALAIIRKSQPEELPDIIFLDLNMPTVNGWEFLEKFEQLSLEKSLEKCLIYILTSSLDTADIAKADDNILVKGFIHKPIDREDMAVILQPNNSF